MRSACSDGARRETRMQTYLETALAREDHAKEVRLFDLGKLFLGRYKAIYEGLYEKDRNLTVRRDVWGFAFTLVSIAALYSAYAWCAVEAVRGSSRSAR
jgi:ATP-binding cassette subfamily B protein